MKLEIAETTANEIVNILTPYCERIQIAGSIRRRKPNVKDIDLVLIPKAPTLKPIIQGIADRVVRSGARLASFIYKGIAVDIYYANEQTWATLLLIRTGSAESNIRLSTLVRNRGWHLSANGDGLLDENGQRIAGDSEEEIFRALGQRYLEPWERG